MKFAATHNALALKKGYEPIQALANWTVRRGRYRAPQGAESRALARRGAEMASALVVRDEGLLFALQADTIHAYTLKELGL